jgi:hypothetical protein
MARPPRTRPASAPAPPPAGLKALNHGAAGDRILHAHHSRDSGRVIAIEAARDRSRGRRRPRSGGRLGARKRPGRAAGGEQQDDANGGSGQRSHNRYLRKETVHSTLAQETRAGQRDRPPHSAGSLARLRSRDPRRRLDRPPGRAYFEPGTFRGRPGGSGKDEPFASSLFDSSDCPVRRARQCPATRRPGRAAGGMARPAGRFQSAFRKSCTSRGVE